MSFIREDDSPWLAAVIVVGLILAALLLWTRTPHAQAATTVTLHGRILATDDEADEGHFTIEPDGEGDSVSLSVTGYLIDFFRGCIGHRATVTIAAP